MSAELVDLNTGEVLTANVAGGVLITDVVIGHRARRDLGDIDSLMASISEVGLLQPIGLMPGNRLLFGGRRLEACRRLGWERIPYVWPRTQDDALTLLTAERDENTCRKEMTPSELVALGTAIEEQERPRAEARRQEGLRSGDVPAPAEARCRTGTTTGERAARTEDIVGAGLGISGSNYHRAKRLVEAASQGDPIAVEAVEQMDRTGSITPAYNAWKGRQPAPSGKPPTTTPAITGRTREALAARAERARELACTGATSSQIAAAVGISNEGLRQLCRREGIEVPADKVVGRTRRLDANRVVEQTVRSAEPSHELLAAINYSDLDRNNLGEWISSLSESLKALRSLKTTLEKELSRVPE